MSQRRHDDHLDQPELHRSERIQRVGDAWFVLTRDNAALGPYATKLEAETSASLLVAEWAEHAGEGWAASVIQSYVVAQPQSKRATLKL